MPDRPSRRGEFELIARYFAPLAAAAPGALGLTDDAAWIRPAPGEELVVTTDALVEGVHFLGTDPPAQIARKALRVNLSDLAAKGAQPLAYLLDTVFSRGVSEEWIAAFAEGLAADQAEYGVALIGGDTTATPGPTMLAITALGTVPAGRMIRRSTAKPGDDVYVSGSIGDAALGLEVLRGGLADLPEAARAHLIGRYRLPQPRLGLGPRLWGLAHAAIDVSDGLVADLGHICETSGLGATVEAGLVPLSAAAQAALVRQPSLLAQILGGGDDYEILFAAPPEAAAALADLAGAEKLALTRIGRVTAGSGVTVLAADGQPMALANAGWRHF